MLSSSLCARGRVGIGIDLMSAFDLLSDRNNKRSIRWAHRSVVTRKAAESTVLRRWMERILHGIASEDPRVPRWAPDPGTARICRQSYKLTALALATTLSSAAISAGTTKLSPSVRRARPRLRGACDETRPQGPPHSPHRTAQIIPRSIGRYGEIRSYDAGMRNCMGIFFKRSVA